MTKLFVLIVFPLYFTVFGLVANEAEITYRLLVLGDIHYTNQRYNPLPYPKKQRSINKYISMWRKKSPELLSAARKQIKSEPVKGVLQLGDLTNGECESELLHEQMFRYAFQTLKNYFPNEPLYTVIGNHDVRQRHSESMGPVRKVLLPRQAKELDRKTLKNGNYCFCIGPDLFVAVDCFEKAEKVSAFLRKTLADHPKTRYVFLLTHYPLFPAADRSPLTLIPHYPEIAAMLEKKRAFVLAAHTHQFSRITRSTKNGKITQIVFTSVGEDWHNGRLIRKFFGNSLSEKCNWDQYLKMTKKRLSSSKHGQALLEELSEIESAGKYDGEFFFRKSGFAILNISDRNIEVRIYLDDSGKPARILQLK